MKLLGLRTTFSATWRRLAPRQKMGRVLIAALIALALIALGFSFVHHYTSFFHHSFTQLTLKVKLMEVLIPIASTGLLLTATLILWNGLTKTRIAKKQAVVQTNNSIQKEDDIRYPVQKSSYEDDLIQKLSAIIQEKDQNKQILQSNNLQIELKKKLCSSNDNQLFMTLNFIYTVAIFHSDNEPLKVIGDLALISTHLDTAVLMALKKRNRIWEGHLYEKQFNALLNQKHLSHSLK